MSEQEKKPDQKSMICLSPKLIQSFFFSCIQRKEKKLQKRMSGGLNKNEKKSI